MVYCTITKHMQQYFIYTRKSYESKDTRILSIESQMAELKELARKLGLSVSKIFRESQSAK
ncbi:MAG: hypothetical protein DRG83_18190, partial [Deltaproteobacteria bacterium]